MKLLLKRQTEQTDPRREFYAQRCAELTEQLDLIRTNFDNVTDPQAIDSLIFAENSLISQLEQLILKAREEGVSIQPYERAKK